MKKLNNLNVLFLEDNLTFAENTIKLFELYFKQVFHTTTMFNALNAFQNKHIDIIISDLKVDDGIALKFIEDVRKLDKKIPIVVLSAHKDEELLLSAIPLGLTFYAIKPINLEEFESIFDKCLNIINEDKNASHHIKDNIYYDWNKKLMYDGDKEISLSKKETLFIELIITNKQHVTTKDQIAEIVWREEPMTEAALKNFLLRLRKKLGKNFITTITNLGYRL